MKNPLQLVPPQEIPQAKFVPLPPDANLLEVFRICTQMEEICLRHKGIGLSAVQVGISWHLFLVVYNVNQKQQSCRYFLNCQYEGLGDKFTSMEACLSLLNKNGNFRYFEVPRFNKIRVQGQELLINSQGLEIQPIDLVVDGLYAVVFQHEIDHGFEILISDIGKEIEII